MARVQRVHVVGVGPHHLQHVELHEEQDVAGEEADAEPADLLVHAGTASGDAAGGFSFDFVRLRRGFTSPIRCACSWLIRMSRAISM